MWENDHSPRPTSGAAQRERKKTKDQKVAPTWLSVDLSVWEGGSFGDFHQVGGLVGWWPGGMGRQWAWFLLAITR